ncbi:MAG: hypothetical protein HOV81_08300 [Kofleriaceae bacterium]|nr:hypothetical protein [Kofleriaceae bacterium]
MRSLAILVVLAGCWTNSSTPAPVPPSEPRASQNVPHYIAPPPREPTPEEQVLQAMSDFMERMCACSDMTCAVQVSNDLTAWSQELARTRPDPPIHLDPEQTKRAGELGMQLGECMQRAVMPPPLPASPQPGPPPLDSPSSP